ncbi:MAG TPA: laccase domain-containing protein [Candidatus Saccharimonas sp.]|nr:laccase domain-containing protein [Candidatus Saccharimonas sp.]
MSLSIHSQLLASTGQLVEGISTAQAGNMSPLYGPTDEVAKARRVFLRDLGTSMDHGIYFRPYNRDVIMDVDAGFAGIGMESGLPVMADALVTRTPGVGLFVLLADCQSISLFDPRAMVIALIHAGRFGLQEQLVTKVIEHLHHHYGSLPENLMAYLGPRLSAEHHVFEPWITQEVSGWGKHMKITANGRYTLDIRGYALEQLRVAGVRIKNIEETPIDTYSSPVFYSHVRSAREGLTEARFGAYLEMKRQG